MDLYRNLEITYYRLSWMRPQVNIVTSKLRKALMRNLEVTTIADQMPQRKPKARLALRAVVK